MMRVEEKCIMVCAEKERDRLMFLKWEVLFKNGCSKGFLSSGVRLCEQR